MDQRLYEQGQRRVWAVAFFFTILFILLGLRLYYLQVVKHGFFTDRVAAQIKRVVELAPRRGNIYDRNGLLLVTTVETYSVCLDGSQIARPQELAGVLGRILSIEPIHILRLIDPNKNFIWVKRKITDQETALVRAARLPGVYLIPEQRRVYLRDMLAAQVLGFVDIDNNGLSGIEYSYDKLLQGIAGKLIIDKDLTGKEIYSSNRVIKEPKGGNQLELTIDEFLQYIARKELKKAVLRYQAAGGSVVMLDVRTGEVLAMLSYPDFNPNYFQRYPRLAWRNDAVQAVYEPGSVFKLITVSGALDSGVISTNYTFVNGNYFEHGGRVIREAHLIKEPQRTRDLRELLVESLNIGAAKLGLKIGKNNLAKYINNYNFGRRSGIQLPGESPGIVKPVEQWSESDSAIIPFGHSIAVTPLQMAAAVAAIANNGVYIKPTIIRRILDAEGRQLKDYTDNARGRRVISEESALIVKEMIQGAVDEGTGYAARIYGYAVGGKTGTSQKIDPVNGGYLPGQYISSFAGILTVNDPRLVILVVIDTPRGQYYGGDVAAPVFKNIAEEAIRYLAIPPDKK